MLMMTFPLWVQATFWGLVSGSALLVGGLVGYYKQVSARMIGVIMAFGSGVLISALAFELMEKAYQGGGFRAAAVGFITGAIIYSVANHLLSKRGAKHRKRSGQHQSAEKDNPSSGTAIAVGALIDAIPESVAIGLSIIHGGAVSIAAVVAIFLSNVPESLSSTSGMKKAGRSKKYIFGVWSFIMLLSGAAAFAGYAIVSDFSPQVIAGVIAVAAGGILAMLSSTMIPEAYEEAHDFIGIITVLGFLAAFILSKMEG
jgi:ZIP family zinc transporter